VRHGTPGPGRAPPLPRCRAAVLPRCHAAAAGGLAPVPPDASAGRHQAAPSPVAW